MTESDTKENIENEPLTPRPQIIINEPVHNTSNINRIINNDSNDLRCNLQIVGCLLCVFTLLVGVVVGIGAAILINTKS